MKTKFMLNSSPRRARIRLVRTIIPNGIGEFDQLKELMDMLKLRQLRVARHSDGFPIAPAIVPCGRTVEGTAEMRDGYLTTEAEMIDEPENVSEDDIFIVFGDA